MARPAVQPISISYGQPSSKLRPRYPGAVDHSSRSVYNKPSIPFRSGHHNANTPSAGFMYRPLSHRPSPPGDERRADLPPRKRERRLSHNDHPDSFPPQSVPRREYNHAHPPYHGPAYGTRSRSRQEPLRPVVDPHAAAHPPHYSKQRDHTLKHPRLIEPHRYDDVRSSHRRHHRSADNKHNQIHAGPSSSGHYQSQHPPPRAAQQSRPRPPLVRELSNPRRRIRSSSRPRPTKRRSAHPPVVDVTQDGGILRNSVTDGVRRMSLGAADDDNGGNGSSEEKHVHFA